MMDQRVEIDLSYPLYGHTDNDFKIIFLLKQAQQHYRLVLAYLNHWRQARRQSSTIHSSPAGLRPAAAACSF